MAEKTIKTRLINKHGAIDQWLTSDLLLKEGEIALAYVNTTQESTDENGNVTVQYVPTYLMKVGHKDANGNEQKFSALPWVHAPASDVYAWAKKANLELADIPMVAVVNKLQDTFYTEEEINNKLLLINNSLSDKAPIVHEHTITANDDDDDVVILEGTSGTNAVSYKASHAKTNKAGTYTKVTVNEYGHITDGSTPTTLAGYSIGDAYTKEEVEGKLTSLDSSKANKVHDHNDLYYTKDELDSKISSVLRYKGNKANYTDLPIEENVIGDVWNITNKYTAEGILVNAGDNVAWNGTSWDVLAGTIDLSSYYDGETIEGKLTELRNAKADEDHTHPLAIALESTRPSSVTLAYGRNYKITAGGNEYVFTMPSDSNTHAVTGIYTGGYETTTNTAAYDPYIAVTDDTVYRSQIRLVAANGTKIYADGAGNISIEALPATNSQNEVMTYIFDCGGPDTDL